jgi:hypothetical protein
LLGFGKIHSPRHSSSERAFHTENVTPTLILAEGAQKMRKLIFVSLAVALFVSVTAFAQDTPKTGDATPNSTTAVAQEPQKPASPETTVTGCLQKGDEPGEVSIMGEDGRNWDLHSTAVKLDQHIGHKVTVTGTMTRESKAEEKKEGEVENASGKREYGDLRVTSLKMVSKTCSK